MTSPGRPWSPETSSAGVFCSLRLIKVYAVFRQPYQVLFGRHELKREVPGFSLAAGGVMPAEAKKIDSRSRVVDCPKCATQFLFRRPTALRFDTRGFESYRLSCENCHTFLTGIIDPLDGTLLVSAT
jgi:hypothetical protein